MEYVASRREEQTIRAELASLTITASDEGLTKVFALETGLEVRGDGRSSADLLDVLLLDGQQRQTLSCLRSLAKLGLHVGVASSGPPSEACLAQHSRACSLRVALPDVTRSASDFTEALLLN